MDVCQLADKGPTVLLTSSRYFHDIREALEKILDGVPAFTHSLGVHGGMGSILLYLQDPLKGASELHDESSTPFGIATDLVAFADKGAQYSGNPPEGRVRGWNIRAITIGPKKAAIAEAVWV
jgi:hypothetical protein